MTVSLHQAAERKKNVIIDQFIYSGIYKIGDVQLYELCLTDLEKEWADVRGKEGMYEKKDI
jgi:hypothetical protein